MFPLERVKPGATEYKWWLDPEQMKPYEPKPGELEAAEDARHRRQLERQEADLEEQKRITAWRADQAEWERLRQTIHPKVLKVVVSRLVREPREVDEYR